jgi:hypothetical protein
MTLPDNDTFGDYGGPMSNWGVDVIDPTTDEDAAHRNKYAANVAMMTRTITRAARSYLGMTFGATTLADPTSGFVHDSLWGSAASDKPVGTFIATGITDLIWPTTVTDELGETHTLSLKRAWAEVEPPASGAFLSAKAKVTAANKVRVWTYTGMTLETLAGETITVFVR